MIFPPRASHKLCRNFWIIRFEIERLNLREPLIAQTGRECLPAPRTKTNLYKRRSSVQYADSILAEFFNKHQSALTLGKILSQLLAAVRFHIIIKGQYFVQVLLVSSSLPLFHPCFQDVSRGHRKLRCHHACDPIRKTVYPCP